MSRPFQNSLAEFGISAILKAWSFAFLEEKRLIFRAFRSAEVKKSARHFSYGLDFHSSFNLCFLDSKIGLKFKNSISFPEYGRTTKTKGDALIWSFSEDILQCPDMWKENRPVRAGGAEGAMVSPQFYRSVNPISIRGTGYTQPITTCPPSIFGPSFGLGAIRKLRKHLGVLSWPAKCLL